MPAVNIFLWEKTCWLRAAPDRYLTWLDSRLAKPYPFATRLPDISAGRTRRSTVG